jgi:integrase
MGRRAQGWRLKWKRGGPGKGVAHVKFTWKGVPHEQSTGERDPAKARAEAERVFAEVVGGGARTVERKRELEEAIGEWLVDIVARPQDHTYSNNWIGTADPVSRAPAIATFSDLTKTRVQRYITIRLRSVTGQTVRCELYALRRFCIWCIGQRYLTSMPEFPKPPACSAGTRNRVTRKSSPIELSVEHVEALVMASPEFSSPIGPHGIFRVRDRFRVLADTGLRPISVAKLAAPRHWYPRRESLLVTADIDKNRFERELPITDGARDALARAHADLGGAPGYLFGYRSNCALNDYLRAAARRIGLPPHIADQVSLYDLRHGRGQSLVDAGASLTGVSYLLGHKQVSTTNRYVRPTRRAAEAALAVLTGTVSGPKAKK